MTPSERLPLGSLLIRRGAVPPETVERTLADPDRTLRLGEHLLERGEVDAEALAAALAEQLRLPHARPPLRPTASALGLVRPDLARRLSAVPLEADDRRVRVGMADPFDPGALAELEFHVGMRVDPVVVSVPALEAALADGYGGPLTDLIERLPTGADSPAREVRSLERAARAQPVVELVDHLLEQAILRKASDIHLEEDHDQLVVRLRMDGLLHRVMELPASSRSAVLSRIKIMAGMDIAEKRRAQDGGFVVDREDGALTFRVSTLPAERGEKAVLRLLNPADAPESLDALGMADTALRRFRRLLGSGHGLLLISGPTGSGKSTTLFSALSEVDRESNNVVTLEDPIEYRIPAATQVQVNRSTGQSFPQLLRAVLRQDPDVLMVGEIRDPETARIAMAAAVTGHLVLSTIHTVDAPSAVTRLLDMGVPDYLVAGGLIGVVAQRLVRRVCSHCRARHRDCEQCVNGLRGRTGVFQMLEITDPIREEITMGASPSVLRRLASLQGASTLMDDARRQVAEGRTTPHEVMRVLQAEQDATLPCSHCGSEMPMDATGCPGCGRRRRPACGCGAQIRVGWRFCANCLRKLPEGAV